MIRIIKEWLWCFSLREYTDFSVWEFFIWWEYRKHLKGRVADLDKIIPQKKKESK